MAIVELWYKGPRMVVDLPGVIEQLQLHGTYISGRNVMACCPNPQHPERTPSFGINLANGKFNCYGCNYRGYLLKLVMDVKRVDKPRAMRILRSARASTDEWKGVITPGSVDKREFKIWDEHVLRMLDEKYDYLESRGISEEVQREWGVRYSSEDDRYIIPVRHVDRKIIGLIGLASPALRELEGTKKVLYTPGLYISRTMLGIDRLRGRTVILVEGAIDALKVYEAIRKPVVCAILNSSFTDGQAQLLERAGVRKVMCMFDNDEAGEKALETVRQRMGQRAVIQRVPYDAPDPADMKVPQIRDLLLAGSTQTVNNQQ